MNKEKKLFSKVLRNPVKYFKKVIRIILEYFYYIETLVLINKNKKRVQKKIKNNEVLNIIFIIQYIPGWSKLEPVYTKMKEDGNFNPYIVCVPLNIQNNKLMNEDTNDTYEYFISQGYEAINALEEDGRWYELQKLEPDYVFHSRPYNHFMPKCYTSRKIRKYALICNILYGINNTINAQNVVLNKNYFRNVYYYFAFDKSEKQFYDKRFSLGCKLGIQKSWLYGVTGLEKVLQSKCERIKSDYQKTVLWTPRWSTDNYIGGSNFFNYKENIISLAKKNKEVLFIFRPHPLMFENFIKTGEMKEWEVDEFKRYCGQEKNIILDESKEYINEFWNSDLLITDASGIVPEYFITEKPILYCHSNVSFVYTQRALDMIRSCYEINNQKDLTRYFYELLNDNDYKLNERIRCINKYFSDVQNTSTNILSVLKKRES